MEPWDGPAAVCATDGRWVVAGKDRNGLRPLRVAVTDDGLLIVGSEAGMTGVAEARIVAKSHISPGRMIAVDLDEGRLYGEDEIIDRLAERPPLHPVARQHGRRWRPRSAPAPSPAAIGREELRRRQVAAGLTLEELELILAPMVEDGQGGDRLDGRRHARWRCCRDHYRPLSPLLPPELQPGDQPAHRPPARSRR